MADYSVSSRLYLFHLFRLKWYDAYFRQNILISPLDKEYTYFQRLVIYKRNIETYIWSLIEMSYDKCSSLLTTSVSIGIIYIFCPDQLKVEARGF